MLAVDESTTAQAAWNLLLTVIQPKEDMVHIVNVREETSSVQLMTDRQTSLREVLEDLPAKVLAHYGR